MPTALALAIRDELEKGAFPIIEAIDRAETRLPWPGQSRSLWPQADISGRLTTGDVFVVEVDDKADPVRSVVKYWPLLHAAASGEFDHPAMWLVVVSAVCSTYGCGFQLLARFVGDRLRTIYPCQLHFAFVELGDRDTCRLAEAIVRSFHDSVEEKTE